MISGRNKRIINAIKKKPVCCETLRDLFDMARAVYKEDNAELSYCLKITSYIKQVIPLLEKSDALNSLYWDVLLWEAPNRFESFLLYMEKNRPYKKKFYEPRMNPLSIVAQDLQDLEDGKYDFYGLSMPPRVGKSTICIFFYAWIIGKRPSSHNAMSGHSGILADRFHNDLIKLTENEEYTFHEIFPDVQLVSKSSEKNELYYDAVESFATTTCRGIDGTWTGAVDISEDGYLYVDDLVRDRKESLSLKRLEGRYQDYLNILVDRKNDGSKELMVGTRWNVADPLGRIEKQYKNNPRYKFRKLPALNEKGESNFNYPVKGFSTKYYHNMRDRLDKNEWMAKFMQTPFVREGLLFPADELRYYNGVLPEGDHRVIGACDVAWGGGDSLSMPIGYEYPNGDVYIPSWIFNKGKKEVTIPLVTGKIIGEKLTEIQFEANNGGDMYSDRVSTELEKHNYHCSCSYKKAPGNMEKMTKMVAYSGDVKKHFIFLDPEHQDQEYSDAMDELNMTVQIGDNEHDDAGDGITQLAMKIYGDIDGPASIIQSPV
nr:MAG TPA_asm: Terminase [Bacteriophage sp.]